jgi:ribosomal protein S18 acetylase RimI-like enzyme
MHLFSEAYRAQFHLLSCLGNVVDAEGSKTILSPMDPEWYWGSFMVFSGQPQRGDKVAWEEKWDKTFREYREIRHRSFCWNSVDGDQGDCSDFLEGGYEIYHSLTMIAESPPEKFSLPPGLSVRKAVSEEDWKKVTELQCLVDEEKYKGGTGNYKMVQMKNFRKLCAEEKGQWFCAFSGETLAGDMGFFDGGNKTGLIVFVETHPAFRRRGICSLLTKTVISEAFTHSWKKVVLVAMKDHPAVSMYQQCGMKITEQTTELCLPRR